MKTIKPIWAVLLAGVASIVLLTACSGDDIGGWYYVEVAPAKFIPVKFSKMLPRDLVVNYSNQVVVFKTPVGPNAPQSLMEYQGKLYVLAFDASPIQVVKWRWRCYRQEGERFQEIPDRDFPRSIAILNLWRPNDPSRYATGLGGVSIDYIEIGRKLDPEGYLCNSEQGRLWAMLEVTNSYERSNMVSEEWPDFLRRYKAKYNPVHLTSMELKPVPKSERNF